MPPDTDVHATSHDRHDRLLVAALAADDLAGTDRDQALALTRTCPDCAILLADLRSIAQATAVAPPPIRVRPRDFRLTEADAGRLRPSGWRRFVGALSRPTLVWSRPLGVGLATLGLAGLLIGNVQIGGSSAGSPARATTAAQDAAAASDSGGSLSGGGPVPAAAASGGNLGPVSGAASPAASSAPNYGTAIESSIPRASSAGGEVAAPPASGAKGLITDQGAGGPPPSSASPLDNEPGPAGPITALNLLFGLAIVVGLTLLGTSLYRGRRRA